jgi:hypothetical protein
MLPYPVNSLSRFSQPGQYPTAMPTWGPTNPIQQRFPVQLQQPTGLFPARNQPYFPSMGGQPMPVHDPMQFPQAQPNMMTAQQNFGPPMSQQPIPYRDPMMFPANGVNTLGSFLRR